MDRRHADRHQYPVQRPDAVDAVAGASTGDRIAACVPNIGPEQRRRRVRGGLISLGITAAIAVVLVANDASRLLRLVVFLPACAAGLGLFQAQAQTCVALAARGTRNMDEGERRIADAGELAVVRSQANAVYLRTVFAAAVVTALIMAL